MAEQGRFESSKIAKNTLYMYLRMFVLMLVTLYTSRIVLQNLGVSDYGIYNVVGGIVIVFSFINGVMTSSTTRFISFAIGEGKIENVKRIFYTTLFLHVAFGIIVVLLSETIGLWYLMNVMNIPNDRIQIAQYVLHFSVINSFFLVLRVPYNSLVIANERMDVYAYISIIDVVMKLLIAFSLTYFFYDRLFVYSCLNAILGVFIFLLYYTYCRRAFQFGLEFVRVEKNVVKDIIKYCSWSLMGSLSGVGNTQGLNIILNYFFGTVVNAAYGISMQVQTAINQLSLGFQTALNPQITKSYASGETKRHKKLICVSVKYSCFLICLMAFPIYFNIREILDLWLVNYPHESIGFLKIIIITSIISCIGNPFGVCIEATGNIARFSVYVSLINITVPIISLFILNFLKIPYIVFIFVLISTLIVQIVKSYYCYKMINLSYRMLWKHSIVPILLVIIPAIIIGSALKLYISSFIIRIICLLTVLSILILFWGLSLKERSTVINCIGNKLSQKK